MWFGDDRSKRRRAGNARRSDRGELLKVQARSAGAGRDRAHKIGAIVLLVVALAGAAWAALVGVQQIGAWMFSENEYFTIRQLDIRTNGKLPARNVQEYAQLAEGQNLFGVNLDRVRHDLELVPLIREARVERKLPDTLVIRITERTPIARIKQPDWPADLSMDREGYILGIASRTTVLPAISGLREKGLSPGSQVQDPSIADALLALELCATTPVGRIVQIVSIDVSHPEYLDTRLATGQRAMLSRENIQVKLDALADIVVRNQETGRSWTMADLTVDRNFPVQ